MGLLRDASGMRQEASTCGSYCFLIIWRGNIACDISGITTKAPCEAALMGECHMRIEISAFVMRTFVLVKLVLCHRVESETIDRKQNR